VLLEVAGKPILGHIIDKVVGEGITEATIVVGHMSEKIQEYVGSAYPSFRVTYIEQEERLGLGHAIYLARDTMGDEPVLIILGDTIFDVDLTPVVRGETSALGVKAVEDPRRFGVAEIVDGMITRLVEKPEKPTTNLAVVGLYFIRNTRLLKECLHELVAGDKRTKGEYQLTDALQSMIEKGETMVPFTVDGWYDCGKPETLLSTNSALLEKRSTTRTMPGVVVNEPVYISPTATLSNCIVGPNASVGHHAEITDAVVRNSIIGEDAKVTGLLLENSIVGNGSVLTGGYRRINVGGASEIDLF
jgi:glucose-1-phosphate thymidylyltransferase